MNTKKFLCEYFGETMLADKETVKVVSIWSFISRGAVHTINGSFIVGVLGIIIYLMGLPVLHILNRRPELVDVTGTLTMVGYLTWFIVILVVGTIILYYVYKYLDKKEICRCIDKGK